jgi:asparagine synthase (glutamine-hydrolysing)
LLKENIGLGHTRLSIIDLSDNGNQPMQDSSGRYAITYNGEIYNFSELKAEYLNDYKFESSCDTEVLLAMYSKYGKDMLGYINGMFSFAIWDFKEKILFAARDRLGKKPFYYHKNRDRFVFTSELNALVKKKDISKDINSDAILIYLNRQSIPAPMTIYQDIHKLPPASYLILNNSQVTIESYWQVPGMSLQNDSAHSGSLDDITADCEKKISEAVRKRLIADVPVGVLLSGGIDSALITGLASEVSSKRVKSFTLAFEDERFNEFENARKAATHFGTEHHELLLPSIDSSDAEKVVLRYGEPYADSSALPTYYISKYSREHVKVILTGDGGDELCCGYPGYKSTELEKLIAGTSISLRLKLFRLLNKGRAFAGSMLSRFSLINTCSIPFLPEGRRGEIGTQWNSSMLKSLINKDFNENPGAVIHKFMNNLYMKSEEFSGDLVSRKQFLDYINYLPDCLLVKMDIASMACSLEARSPLLDYEVIECFSKIPSSYKADQNQEKVILKKLVEKRLGREYVNAPKHGFSVPVGDWLRNSLCEDFKQKVINSEKIKNIMDCNYIEKLFSNHISRTEDHAGRLWTLYCLGVWLENKA